MKIYIVNGRKVWLDKAPEGAIEFKPETEVKARKAPANKSRKAGNNK